MEVVLSRSRTTRGLALLEEDEYGVLAVVHVEATVALARCPCCRSRFRVLPCDVLPRKHYALQVIEHLVQGYSGGDRSLRSVAWSVSGERTPVHATLHAWTEGLGAHALGLAGGDVPGGTPIAALVAESFSRRPELAGPWHQQTVIDPRRYRSEPRRERLAQVVRVLDLAGGVTGVGPPQRLWTWRQSTLRWGVTSPLAFRTGNSCTSIEQAGLRPRPPSRRPHTGAPRPWPTPTRSPPGASRKSPP